MKCPHCKVVVRIEWALEWVNEVFQDDTPSLGDPAVEVRGAHCPNCSQFIVLLAEGPMNIPYHGKFALQFDEKAYFAYPRFADVREVESEVPAEVKSDYLEACVIQSLSPKASAALSRRLLQHVFREALGITRPTLDQEIQEFISRPNVPQLLKEAVDAVRVVGNFAAHPSKDQHTGEIVEVEPEEAEWLLDVLEALFDFVYVQPARLAVKTANLNAKLAAMGKPAMRRPSPPATP